MTKLVSTNPAKNYEVLGEVDISSDDEIQIKIAAANKAKRSWKELGLAERISMLRPICDEFKQRIDEMASLVTNEIGKPINESMSEVTSSIEEIEWFFQNAEVSLRDEVTYEDEASLHKIVYDPFGTVAVISPWNFPFEMAMRGIIPNLIVGNTVVFKISEECPLMGKLIEDVVTKYLPEGVFAEVYGAGNVGEKLAKGDIDFIRFTGSTKVGQLLYKIASDKFIKVVLEMGGSNPCIVFDDVNVADVIPTIYGGRFGNCGQVCDATKRLIVHESIADNLITQLHKFLENKQIGDPSSPDTDLGSLVAQRQQVLLQEQVEDAKKQGANIIEIKLPNELKGAFYQPTIITNITKDMRVWKEEVFGPVLPVIAFKTEEEAIALANDTMYGLGSKVFSKDINRAKRVASQIEAGTVEINGASRRLSCNPFGGYKKSGMGREHGTVGYRELCQIKLISAEK